ncbi:MAG: hypothetical protein H0V80_01830 [Acidobacteria bacterium]|nr:hypothetical protein [Acidobacteriota bacterium]
MRAWLNVGEAFYYYVVWKYLIYTACERSELRHVRIGGRRCIRVRPAWLDEWYERSTRHLPGGGSGANATTTAVTSVGR